jgi:predicted LPLAT superfamily acyltransferase
MSPATPGAWTSLAESGSIAALRAMAWFHRRFGRAPSRALLHPIAGYFWLRRGAVRRASRAWFEAVAATPEGRRALGRGARARDSYAHLHEFATQLLDRLVLWGGGIDTLRITHEGSEHLFDLARRGRGALLLGSHLGSFDLLRLLAGRHGLRVSVLMYTEHAERITSFFERLAPGSAVRVLRLDPGSLRTGFEIRACLERGEFVGILADRLPPGGRERPARVPFLGRSAAFPLSPFRLAATLGCPALVALCTRTGPGSYHASVAFVTRGERAPRAEREKRAREALLAYVAALERAALRAPRQWFNFYDYFGEGSP